MHTMYFSSFFVNTQGFSHIVLPYYHMASIYIYIFIYFDSIKISPVSRAYTHIYIYNVICVCKSKISSLKFRMFDQEADYSYII